MTDTSIVLRRSAVPGKTPTDSQLALGEVAINTYDGKMFFKQQSTSNSILEVATTSTNLGQFATTTSAQLASVISDETGTGSLVFNTGSSFSGNTNFDSGTLFVDSVNDRIGVGTTTPGSKFDVVGNIRLGTQTNRATLTYTTNTARTYTLPDAGANADFVMTAGNQTISGDKTFSNPVILSSAGTATNHAVRADRTLQIQAGSNITIGGAGTSAQDLTSNRSWTINAANTNLGVIAGTTSGPTITSSTGTDVTIPVASATASGVVTTGNQTFAGVKTFNSTITGSVSGNAGTATVLATPRTITIGSTGKTFDGSANISWSLSEIGVNNSTLTLSTSGIATGSQTWTSNQGTNATFTVNVPGTNIAQGTRTTTTVPITSSTGTNATLDVATTTLAGVMSSADKTKLDGIAAGAQVNVGTNLGSSGTGGTRTITSSTGSDTSITYTAADLGAVPTARTISTTGIATGGGDLTTNRTINVPGTNIAQGTRTTTTVPITSSTGTDGTLDAATTLLAGVMSSADKTKLDGIAAGAQVNVPTNLSIGVSTGTEVRIDSSTGTNATLPAASATLAGVITNAAQTFAGAKTFNNTLTLRPVSYGSNQLGGLTIRSNNPTAGGWADQDFGIFLRSDGNGVPTLVLRERDVDALTIRNGNIGIGTTSPNELLEVAGNIRLGTQANRATITYGTNTARTYTLPDAGANADFVMTESNQTIGGAKTFTGSINSDSNNVLTLNTMFGFESSGELRLGRKDGVLRYNSIESFNTNILSNNFMKIKIHNGTVDQTTDVMTLLGNGNVGIGTILPNELLEVAGNIRLGTQANRATITYGTNTARTYTIPDAGANANFVMTAGNQTVNGLKTFGTNPRSSAAQGTNAADLTRRDFVTGLDSENVKLTGGQTISGAKTFTALGRFNHSGADPVSSLDATRLNDGNVMRFGNVGNIASFAEVKGTINVSGNVTSYNTSSDYRLKENITDLQNAIQRVTQIPVRRFNFIGEVKIIDGFIAHELQQYVPEAVIGEKDAVVDVGNIVDTSTGDVIEQNVPEPGTIPDDYIWVKTDQQPEYQQIDAAKLIPLLTASIQELLVMVNNLASRIEALEKER
jgi:hypothetical protein